MLRRQNRVYKLQEQRSGRRGFASRFEAKKDAKPSACFEAVKKELGKKLKPEEFAHENRALTSRWLAV
jgi:hypothetical protein